ncbi:DUF805 domain-containing protein [Jannaschia seohaensis]|uniref:Uncharacterized membrane protein YhaH (DUF805 family) n=1 Tax=Jannaschia seohaensis TaxID=475081 RepID=A0A2Y9AAW0_9RHOB|nr:DUF805 domain-containing protein [Jannaschia seohaensis]PWJ21321.1 uncharacterized membrane protein YhaH (DUF805 family) [Jannaschia seohaensis]SSA41731.1 Uncharacterized membrane protein YhaH, DUF805 family [Jannaschia seohaensis]
MGPIDATLRCLARPFSWSGRAAPSEYWWFTLVYWIFGSAVWLGLLWPFLELAWLEAQGMPQRIDPVLMRDRLIMLGWATVLGTWPMLNALAVAVRRPHDTDRSGWWYWIQLVPFVGWLILLVLLILPGDPGRNANGKPPGGGSGYAPGEVGRPADVRAQDPPPLDPSLRAPVEMGPLRVTLSCLAAPFTWSGRAGPGEYWWFTLVSVSASILALTYLAWPVFAEIDAWEAAMQAEQDRAYKEIRAVQPIPFPDLRPAFEQNLIGWIAFLLLCVPVGLSSCAVTVRRLHDTDHSGWWYWIALVPVVGVIFLIVPLAAPGQMHRNRFGPGRSVRREASIRGSDLPVVPRDPLSELRGADALRALRQSRMEGGS